MAMKGTGRSNYPYAVARVQAKRGKLIPRSQYEKFLKMDVSEITRFIGESQYQAEVEELSSRFSGLDLIEAALTVNLERTHASVQRMLSGQGAVIVQQFLARHFVGGIKTVLRGKVAGAGRDELLKELLLEDLDTYNLFLPLLEEDVRTVEDTIDAMEKQGAVGARWARILRKVPSGSQLPAYEDALDKAYYAQLLEAVHDFSGKGAQALRHFVRREIDARNLQNAARWVHAGAKGDFTPYIIPGGRALPVAKVKALAEAADLGAFEELIADEPAFQQVKEGLRHAREIGRIGPFAIAVQTSMAVDLDRIAGANPLSILPVLTFLLRKHDEVAALRTLARGKAAGLGDERLQELLP